MSNQMISERPLLQRALQFPLTRLLILGGIIFFLMAWTEEQMLAVKDSPAFALAIALVMSFVALAIYTGWGRLIERRDVSELSTPRLGRECATGILIGAALYTACVVSLIAFGVYTIEGLNPLIFLVPAAGMAIKSAVFEELVFRGVLFKSVEDMAGSWISIAVSSLVFGAVHLINPDATIAGAAYIGIEAGLLLAAAYLVTRRLWLCIGFHLGWNYFESGVFSGIVSGSGSEPGLVRIKVDGPDILTGGSFGMELSIFALIYCSAAGIVLLMIAIQRGHLVQAPWSRKA